MEQLKISSEHTPLEPGRNVTIKNFDAWSISIYKKQKRIIMETHEYHAGPLIITKDELCDIAKMMGLHVRKNKRKRKANDNLST